MAGNPIGAGGGRGYRGRMMNLRAFARRRAIEVALDLMLTAKSEAIRARMCEFLAADAKVSPVAVHVDNRMVTGPGYVYIRPEERLADILDGDTDD